MNKKYIKRQLTLHKLGFSMNEDVQQYVDYFYELIGDPNNLKKEYGVSYGKYEGYLFFKNNIKILFYDIKNKIFLVDFSIWKKFEGKFRLNYTEITYLFTCLLEESFKCYEITAKLINKLTIESLGKVK